jgi:hypothetical protein
MQRDLVVRAQDADGGNARQFSVSPKLIDQVMAASGGPFSWPPQP